METMAVQRTDDAGSSTIECPSEAQLRQDIRYFEGQIARLASPSSTWEHGALNCYRTLVRQRREMLAAVKSSATSSL